MVKKDSNGNKYYTEEDAKTFIEENPIKGTLLKYIAIIVVTGLRLLFIIIMSSMAIGFALIAVSLFVWLIKFSIGVWV